MSSFNLSSIPGLEGKVILITGGNTGLGKEAAFQLAKHNAAHIFLTSRDISKAHLAISYIKTAVLSSPTEFTPILIDLSSLSSVYTAAKEILTKTTRLDILMNNAGIMAVPPSLSTDGYEIQFTTNYLGHALLTKLLLPILLTSAQEEGSDIRILNLTSHSHQRAPTVGINFSSLRTLDLSSPLSNYGQSKLANILHVKELAQRYPSIKVVAIHPGMVNTDLTTTMKKSFLLARIAMPIVSWWQGVSVEEGVKNQLWGATSLEVKSGEYYEPVGNGGLGSALTKDEELAERLWEWTEEEFVKKGYGG